MLTFDQWSLYHGWSTEFFRYSKLAVIPFYSMLVSIKRVVCESCIFLSCRNEVMTKVMKLMFENVIPIAKKGKIRWNFGGLICILLKLESLKIVLSKITNLAEKYGSLWLRGRPKSIIANAALKLLWSCSILVSKEPVISNSSTYKITRHQAIMVEGIEIVRRTSLESKRKKEIVNLVIPRIQSLFRAL